MESGLRPTHRQGWADELSTGLMAVCTDAGSHAAQQPQATASYVSRAWGEMGPLPAEGSPVRDDTSASSPVARRAARSPQTRQHVSLQPGRETPPLAHRSLPGDPLPLPRGLHRAEKVVAGGVGGHSASPSSADRQPRGPLKQPPKFPGLAPNHSSYEGQDCNLMQLWEIRFSKCTLPS